MRKEVKMRKRKRMKKRRKKKVRKRKKNQVRTLLTCNVNILMVKIKRLYYSENTGICCLIKFTLVIEFDVTFVNSIMQS